MEVRNEKTRAFLRRHFRFCLFVGIFGGDISKDIASGQYAWERMQVKAKEGGEYTNKFPSGGDWDTLLGEAVKEWVSERIEAKEHSDNERGVNNSSV